MKYYYRCGKERDDACKLAETPDEVFENLTVALKEKWITFTEDGEIDHSQTPLVWETEHSMGETPEIKCPVCESSALRLISGGEFYFRGNGYLDKAGCRRDMNLYKLQQNDPYGYMRQPGEAEHLADSIRKRGKRDPKREYFIPKKGGGGFTRN